MTSGFVLELNEQRAHALFRLREAEAAGDEVLAQALRDRLDDLDDIATRNGVTARDGAVS